MYLVNLQLTRSAVATTSNEYSLLTKMPSVSWNVSLFTMLTSFAFLFPERQMTDIQTQVIITSRPRFRDGPFFLQRKILGYRMAKNVQIQGPTNQGHPKGPWIVCSILRRS